MKEHIFSKIPTLFEKEDNVFKSAEDLQLSLRGLVKILARRNSRTLIPSYLIEKFEIEFSCEYAHEHIFIDHANSAFVVRVPKRRREKLASLEIKRQIYLLKYSVLAEEMRARGLIQAFRALDKGARRKLIETEKGFNQK